MIVSWYFQAKISWYFWYFLYFRYFQNIKLYYYYLLTFLIHAYLTQTAQVPKLLDAAKILTKIVGLTIVFILYLAVSWRNKRWRQSAAELWPKTIFNMAAVRHLKFLKFVLVTWLPTSSISAAVYQIPSKSDNLSLICGDLTIFKTAGVRHLGFSVQE